MCNTVTDMDCLDELVRKYQDCISYRWLLGNLQEKSESTFLDKHVLRQILAVHQERMALTAIQLRKKKCNRDSVFNTEAKYY